MALKYPLAEWVDFTVKHWYHSCTLEPKVETPNSGEKRSEFHFTHALKWPNPEPVRAFSSHLGRRRTNPKLAERSGSRTLLVGSSSRARRTRLSTPPSWPRSGPPDTASLVPSLRKSKFALR